MRVKTLFLLLIGMVVFNRVDAQVQWGVKGGGNLSAMLLKEDGGYLKTKLIPGFHIGGLAEISLSEKFAIQPSLLFSAKGFKIDQDGFAEYLYGLENIKFSSYYIELPINFVFKPELESGHLLLGAGPYIGYGLGGNWKTDVSSLNVKGKLKFIDDVSSQDSSLLGGSTTIPYAQKFDFGANILIGYEFSSHFFFHINGQIGLIDIQPRLDGMKENNTSMKTVGGGVTIGYKFGKF